MRLNVYFFLGQCIILLGNQCHFLNALIGINVRLSREHEFPFIISLAKFNYDEYKQLEIQHFCTGVLISKRNILTAAHCLFEKDLNNIRVIIGSVDIRLGIRHQIVQWLSYVQWSTEKSIVLIEHQKHDIAIAKLNKEVDDEIKPISISSLTFSEMYGLDVIASGWGSANTFLLPILMETVNLKIWSNEDCEKRVRKIHGKRVPFFENILCTSAMPPAVVTYGDSGGPLLYNDTLVAITFGTCLYQGQPLHPGKINLHSAIDYYIPFILDFKNNN